jgi:hypothetical protein
MAVHTHTTRALPPVLEGRAALTIDELAYACGWSRQHIYNEIGRGNIRTFTLGKTRRIAVDEVLRILGGEAA